MAGCVRKRKPAAEANVIRRGLLRCSQMAFPSRWRSRSRARAVEPSQPERVAPVRRFSPAGSLSVSEVAFDPQRADGGCEAIVLRHQQAEFDQPAVVEMCRQRSPGGVVEVLGLDEGIDSSQ